MKYHTRLRVSHGQTIRIQNFRQLPNDGHRLGAGSRLGCDGYFPADRSHRQLLANTNHWLDQKTFPIDECLIRFHHQLVKIPPSENGNGRHARMITDVLGAKYGQPKISWGTGTNLVAEGGARLMRTRTTSSHFLNLRDLDAHARALLRKRRVSLNLASCLNAYYAEVTVMPRSPSGRPTPSCRNQQIGQSGSCISSVLDLLTRCRLRY